MDSSVVYSVDEDMCRSESPFLTSGCTVPLRGRVSVSGFMEVDTEEEKVDRVEGLSASRIRFEDDSDGGGIGKEERRLSSCCESASNSAT